ncbi:MAG: sigma-54-dependent Fis family transcriptional regulator [Caldisericaceae bacterium]|nr:sigma-54-dependent Fis family transcriptional regulator [Caldisericaceae bacterium]
MKLKKYTILVVDDEKNVRDLLKEILEEEDYTVLEADNGKKAVEEVTEKYPDCILLDVRMPVMDGMEAFLKIREVAPDLPVIFLTAYGSSDIAIKAMKKGAYDYLTKPFDIDELKIKVKKAIELKELSASLEGTSFIKNYKQDEIIGDSPKMQEVYKAIGRVADSDATVLIRGESGTGKELVAKAIYLHSNRRNKPFIVVNCAAIPENLLESELFGHEKGAFTDAISRHIGKFEQAKDGTIFLDEIGDMSLPLQAKLLRVLQEKTFERVGGHETLVSNARVLAATNRDLEQLVSEGKFREDLFYRLNVVTIHIPPLRERKEDIPLLVNYFISKYSRKYGKVIQGVSEEVMKIFMDYNWPGNVRELENAIARGVIISSVPLIMKEHLPPELLQKIESEEKINSASKSGTNKENTEDPVVEPLPDAIAKLEKEMIIKALRKCNGNKTKAAKLLGISRKSLFNKIRDYKINME